MRVKLRLSRLARSKRGARSIDRGVRGIEVKSWANVDHELSEGSFRSCAGNGSAIVRRWSSVMCHGKNG